jgi:hypothetical protein
MQSKDVTTHKTKYVFETTEPCLGKNAVENRDEDIKKSSKVKDEKEWVHKQKIKWNELINRIEENRSAKIAGDKSLICKQSIN